MIYDISIISYTVKHFNKNGTYDQYPRYVPFIDLNSYHEKSPDKSTAMLPFLNVTLPSKDRKPMSNQDLTHRRHLNKESYKDLADSLM